MEPSVPVRIYTSRACGWAKRNYAALLAKGIPFELVPAKDEHGNKTPEFLALTPLARTPVFVHGKTVLWESLIINEYIAESFPGPGLNYTTPAERAETRLWLDYCDTVPGRLLNGIYKADGIESETIARISFDEAMAALSRQFTSRAHDRQFWFGQEFGLIDIGYALLFDSIRFIEQELNVQLLEPDSPLGEWRKRIDEVPCIRQARQIHDSFYANPTKRIVDPELLAATSG